MERRELLKNSAGAVAGTSLLTGCLGDSSPDEATFTVEYFGRWAGSVSTGESSQSISGDGRNSYTITDPTIVSGNAQKRDNRESTLTVSISVNREVVAQTSTRAQYGLAQVSHTF